jgi:hypothetical protein
LELSVEPNTAELKTTPRVAYWFVIVVPTANSENVIASTWSSRPMPGRR